MNQKLVTKIGLKGWEYYVMLTDSELEDKEETPTKVARAQGIVEEIGSGDSPGL